MTRTHVVLAGSRRPRKQGAEKLADIDPSERIEVTVTLRGPALPDVEPGRSISREELERSFGASREDIARVESELRKFGLSIDDVSPLSRTMRVSGTAARMQEAFHAGLGIYTHAREGEFRGREGSIEIPAALEQEILTRIDRAGLHICEAELRYKLRWDDHTHGFLLELLDELERQGLIESALHFRLTDTGRAQLSDDYEPPLRYGNGGIPWQVRS